jgi:hypothetical protein
MCCHSEKSKYLCLYVTLVIKTYLKSTQSLCESTDDDVLDALLWLKKHNPHYSNVAINESNLDWMKDKDKANIGQEGTILSTKDTQCYKVLMTQEEMVSNAHIRMDFSDCAGNTCDIEIGAMHPNVGNSLPNAHNTKIIQSLIDIAKNTDQSSKIMNFPSIDHDNPVK